MADDCEQFAKPVNSVEKLGNKAKMPEVAISKREDSKASIEQVDFLKAPKENKGPSQLLPSISRAQVIEEYNIVRQMTTNRRHTKLIVTDLLQDILRKTAASGNLQLIDKVKDNPNWKRVISLCSSRWKKLFKDHIYASKKPTNIFPNPDGVFFTFQDWPDLLCEKQYGQERISAQDSIPEFDYTKEKALGSKLPGITRAKVIEEYLKAQEDKVCRGGRIPIENYTSFAYDLLVNTEYDNYQLVKNFEDNPNWTRAVKKLTHVIKAKVLKDFAYSKKKPSNIFKDPQGLCFSFSDFPDLLCEKQNSVQNTSLADVPGSKNGINGHKLPHITRAKMLQEYRKARQNISKNQSIVFTDFAHDVLVKTKLDHHQLVEDYEHNPSWKRAVSQCVKAVKLVLKDHIICMKNSTVFEDPDGVSFTFEDWPDLVCEKKPNPQSETQSEPVSEACDQLKGQGVSVALSNRWSCKICLEECESKAHLHRHWCLNHKVFKCCGLEFYGRVQIKEHRSRHRQKNRKLIAEDKKMLLPQKKSSRELKFNCPICGKKFVTANSMLIHKRDEHETMQPLPQYHYSMCRKKYFKEKALKYHESVHYGKSQLNQESPMLVANESGNEKYKASTDSTDSEMKTSQNHDPLRELPQVFRQEDLWKTLLFHQSLKHKSVSPIENIDTNDPTLDNQIAKADSEVSSFSEKKRESVEEISSIDIKDEPIE